MATSFHPLILFLFEFYISLPLRFVVSSSLVNMTKRKCSGPHSGGKGDPQWYRESDLWGPNKDLCRKHYLQSCPSYLVKFLHCFYLSCILSYHGPMGFTKAHSHTHICSFPLFFLFFFASFRKGPKNHILPLKTNQIIASYIHLHTQILPHRHLIQLLLPPHSPLTLHLSFTQPPLHVFV
jgi:hypothetical protein